MESIFHYIGGENYNSFNVNSFRPVFVDDLINSMSQVI